MAAPAGEEVVFHTQTIVRPTREGVGPKGPATPRSEEWPGRVAGLCNESVTPLRVWGGQKMLIFPGLRGGPRRWQSVFGNALKDKTK